MEVIKISPENQQSSDKKWAGICVKVDEHTPFDSLTGWYDLRVVGKCGYCFNSEGFCAQCALYPKYCSLENGFHSDSVYLQFLEVMRKPLISDEETDWSKASKLAYRLWDRIKEDRYYEDS